MNSDLETGKTRVCQLARTGFCPSMRTLKNEGTLKMTLQEPLALRWLSMGSFHIFHFGIKDDSWPAFGVSYVWKNYPGRVDSVPQILDLDKCVCLDLATPAVLDPWLLPPPACFAFLCQRESAGAMPWIVRSVALVAVPCCYYSYCQLQCLFCERSYTVPLTTVTMPREAAEGATCLVWCSDLVS